MNLLLIWLAHEVYGSPFGPHSRSGYVKPSAIHSKRCLIQLPTEYLYRDCDETFTGPAVYDESNEKIFLWPRAAQYGIGYYYETSMDNESVTKSIGMDGKPSDWGIHFFLIPNNAFMAMVKDPQSNAYNFFYLPERDVAIIIDLRMNIDYYPGQIFGPEFSNIAYLLKDIDYSYGFLTFFYFSREFGNYSYFSYTLESKQIRFHSVTSSEQSGATDLAFVGLLDTLDQACLYQLNVSYLNDMIEQKQSLSRLTLDPLLCEKVPSRENSSFAIESLSVKYPYILTGFLWRQNFEKSKNSIVYFTLFNIPNDDHDFTKAAECSERIGALKKRDVLCKFDAQNLDYYTSVINGTLIQRFDEKTGNLTHYSTCFMFNDCYGCRLMYDILRCSWSTDHCIESDQPKESFKKCIRVTNIAVDDTNVALTLEGVRLTNTFMIIKLENNITNETYDPIFVSDYEVSFNLDQFSSMDTKFMLRISNSQIKVPNLVELKINLETSFMYKILRTVLFWGLSIGLIIFAVWLGLIISKATKIGDWGNLKSFSSIIKPTLPPGSSSKEGSIKDADRLSSRTVSDIGTYFPPTSLSSPKDQSAGESTPEIAIPTVSEGKMVKKASSKELPAKLIGKGKSSTNVQFERAKDSIVFQKVK